MEQYVNPFLLNGLIAGISVLAYGLRYIPYKPMCKRAVTKPSGRAVMTISQSLSGEVASCFNDFKAEVEKKSGQGPEINMDAFVKNIMLESVGEQPELDEMHKEKIKEKTSFNVGVLFSNSIAIETGNVDVATHAVVQSMFDALDNLKMFQSSFAAYGTHLQVINDFGGECDVSNYGIIPRRREYYSRVGFALENMAELFPTGQGNNVLYLVTPALKREQEEKIIERIKCAEFNDIHVGVVCVVDKEYSLESDLAGRAVYVSPDAMDEFPRMFRGLNSKLASEGRWKFQ